MEKLQTFPHASFLHGSEDSILKHVCPLLNSAAVYVQAAMTVLPCVVRFAKALIRAINEGYSGTVSRSEQTFLAQCQLLATSFSTIKDGMRILLNAHHAPRLVCLIQLDAALSVYLWSACVP